MRVAPPKNAQRACINLASDFELPGAVAQLVEHLSGTQGARGSSPLSSTPIHEFGTGSEVIRTGSNQFRNHFGYYLERAVAGDEIQITRREREPGLASRNRRVRRLWGRDRGGNFRSHGGNSHATVRGTRWLTVDGCDGTLTRVTDGAVVVKDFARGRRALVREGEKYLARSRAALRRSRR